MMNLLSLENKKVCSLAHNEAVHLMSHLNEMLGGQFTLAYTQQKVSLSLADGTVFIIKPQEASLRNSWSDDHATDHLIVLSASKNATSSCHEIFLDDGITFGQLVEKLLRDVISPMFTEERDMWTKKAVQQKTAPVTLWPIASMQ